MAAALKHFQEQVIAQQKLVALDPSNTSEWNNLAVTKVAVAQAMRDLGRVEESMATMATQLDQLRRRRARLRFSVAMSQLQTECIGSYTVGLIEHREQKSDSRQAISALSDALHLALSGLQDEVRVNGELHEQVENVSAGFRRIQQTLGQWRTLIERYGIGDLVGKNLPVLDTALADGVEQLHRLSELSDRFSDATKTFDPAAIDADLVAVSTLVEAIK